MDEKDLPKKERIEYKDYCCGTEWKYTNDKRFRCIGEGFAAWVSKDWKPGDHPRSAAHICPCKMMPIAQRRHQWVSKYLGDTSGSVNQNVIEAFKTNNSFYVQTHGNINSSIVTICTMTQIKSIKVTGLDDTLNDIGDRYENGQYFLPYECIWICMDAERLPVSVKVSEHLNELIFKSAFGKIGIIITGSEPWSEFVKKHNIGRTKFHNIVS